MKQILSKFAIVYYYVFFVFQIFQIFPLNNDVVPAPYRVETYMDLYLDDVFM